MRQLFVGVLVIALCGAAGAQEKNARLDPMRATAEGAKRFGFELFQSLNKKSKDPVAISPMSITEAITLATHGAEAETRTELEDLFIENMLRKMGADVGLLTAGITRIRESLKQFSAKSGGRFEYSSANSLWANNHPSVRFQFKDDFKNVASRSFGAKVEARNFADDKTVKELNAWVAKETKEKIKELLSKLNPDDVAVILNAIYAKGKFKNHFNVISEREYKGGKAKKASFLTKEEQMGFYSDKRTKIFSFLAEEKDPGRDSMTNQIALDILVPEDGKLDDLAERLDAGYYNELVSKLAQKDIKLSIPAGKVEHKDATKLKAILTEIPFDLKRSFDPNDAQFGKLGTVVDKKNIHINDILTKTFYEVTPFGFEAAAATAIVFARESAIFRPKSEEHVIDTPAIHVIRHVPSGLPLFIVEYDSPTLYKQDEIVALVEEGSKHSTPVTAELEGGKRITATYDEKSKGMVIAIVDKEWKIERVLKPLKK